jgi:hypothetical protein
MTDQGEHDGRDGEVVGERLEQVRPEWDAGLADRLMAIGKDCAPRLKEPFRSADHSELLYDEHDCRDDHRWP